MKDCFSRWEDSYKELSGIRTIAVCAMMIALNLALSMLTVYITPFLRLNFDFLALATVGALFGPVPAAMCGAACDVLAYFFKGGGAFFPGFTISAVLSGMIYGMFFYQRSFGYLRCLFCKLTVNLVINLFLNTYWLSIMMADSVWAMLPPRILKNLLLLPLESLMLCVLLQVLTRLRILAPKS